MDELELRRTVERAARAESILLNRDMQSVFKELANVTHEQIDRIDDRDIEGLRTLKIRLTGLQGIQGELKKWVNEGKRAKHLLDEMRAATRGTNRS